MLAGIAAVSGGEPQPPSAGPDAKTPKSDAAKTDDSKPKISQVYLVQHYVQELDDPLFKLVGNLETLVKVHVGGRKSISAPDVFVRLSLDSNMHYFE